MNAFYRALGLTAKDSLIPFMYETLRNLSKDARGCMFSPGKAALPPERNIYTQETDNCCAFCLVSDASVRKDEN